MGEVYRVLDLAQDQACALKILNEMMDEQAVRRRFHREFQVLSRFQHPRLVRTYAWGFAEGRPLFYNGIFARENIGKNYCPIRSC